MFENTTKLTGAINISKAQGDASNILSTEHEILTVDQSFVLGTSTCYLQLKMLQGVHSFAGNICLFNTFKLRTYWKMLRNVTSLQTIKPTDHDHPPLQLRTRHSWSLRFTSLETHFSRALVPPSSWGPSSTSWSGSWKKGWTINSKEGFSSSGDNWVFEFSKIM